MKHYYWVFLCLLLLSCSKDGNDENLNPLSNISFSYIDKLDQITLNLDESGINLNGATYKWTCTNGDIEIHDSTHKTAYIVIPEGNNEKQIEIKLTVSCGGFEGSDAQSITLPVLSDVRRFGLGKTLNEEKSNNVNYEWYFDQAYTGTHSSINCGPSCVTMAIKWVNKDFSKTPQDARNQISPSGGWWYTNNISDYLTSNNTSHYTIPLPDLDALKTVINEGNIAILCLDMFYISSETNPQYHVDRFYETSSSGWGHFIVIKGYKEVNNTLFFEAYDPYSYNNKYNDGQLKGIDRYYRKLDLEAATSVWWQYAIVVSRSTNLRSSMGVDINTIPHMPGR